MKASFQLTHKAHWGKIAPKTIDLLDQAVRTTAFEVERGAKMLAPVDTGALRASIYTVTSRSTSFMGARNTARKRRKGVRMFGALQKPKSLEAMVAVGVEYGAYMEYGTRRTASRPFLKPATMAQSRAFRSRIAAAMRKGAQ